MKRLSFRVPQQEGVALVAVLWICLALSVMVVGVSNMLRSEIRIARDSQDAVLKSAIADAGIRMALIEMNQQRTQRLSRIQSRMYEFEGHTISIDVVPLNGWINLNEASSGLIADALILGGGLSPDLARSIADWVVQQRQLPAIDGGPRKMHSVEDLARAPGMHHEAFLAIQPLFTVDLQTGGAINPAAAPFEVLKVLSSGQDALAQQVLASRQADGALVDFTRLQVGHSQVSDSSAIQIEARVAASDTTSVVRVWRVSMTGEAYGLPWRVLSIDPPKLVRTRPAAKPT